MKVETRISFIEKLNNGIIRVEIKPDIQLEPEDLDENFITYTQKLKIKHGLFLLVFKPGGESNMEARLKYASAERFKIKKAEAIVIETLAHRLGANFYKKMFKPTHPVKVFIKEQEAIDWLLLI
ncbi:MAG: hypothetical protein RJQ00_01170 [Vicingaceae bacterium]